MKICNCCGKEFNATGHNQKFCSKKCQTKTAWKKYYEAHPVELKLKRDKENSFLEKKILSRIKSRCKKENIEFDLELSDINIPDRCPILNIEIAYAHGNKSGGDCSPSVDRIDPDKGYTKGNVRVISMRANLLKSNAKIWELELVLKDLKSFV